MNTVFNRAVLTPRFGRYRSQWPVFHLQTSSAQAVVHPLTSFSPMALHELHQSTSFLWVVLNPTHLRTFVERDIQPLESLSFHRKTYFSPLVVATVSKASTSPRVISVQVSLVDKSHWPAPDCPRPSSARPGARPTSEGLCRSSSSSQRPVHRTLGHRVEADDASASRRVLRTSRKTKGNIFKNSLSIFYQICSICRLCWQRIHSIVAS